MTGTEHYLEAEKLLDRLKTVERGASAELGMLAEAQVHATLALAAAGKVTTPKPPADTSWLKTGNQT